jgi:hypothetical protein
MLTPELLDRMTNSDQPGPIRLLAAEALLAANPNDSDGIDVLRGLGRQSNREMILAIARILQTYLQLDMGLPPDGLDAKSKHAPEIARRVLSWAIGRPEPNGTSDTPSPVAMTGLPPAGQPGTAGSKKVW